jgi:hypothetical protein
MGTFDEWMSKYMVYVDRAVGMIPYRRIGVWKEFFFNPSATVSKNIDSIGERLKDLYVANGIEVILGLIAAIPALLITLLGSGGGALGAVGLGAGIGILLAIIVVGYLIGPLLYLIYALLEYVIAKLLGTTADFRSHFNASVLPALATFVVLLPITIVSIPFQWLESIPLIGFCGSLIMLVIGVAEFVVELYGLYLKYLAFREVHKLSTIRTLAVVFLPVILLIAIVIVAFIALYAAIAAMLLGSLGSSSLLSPV